VNCATVDYDDVIRKLGTEPITSCKDLFMKVRRGVICKTGILNDSQVAYVIDIICVLISLRLDVIQVDLYGDDVGVDRLYKITILDALGK